MTGEGAATADSFIAAFASSGITPGRLLSDSGNTRVFEVPAQVPRINTACALKYPRRARPGIFNSYAWQYTGARLVDHENVVKGHQLGVADGRPFLLCELMPTSLAQLMRSGRQLSVEEVADLGMQAAEGLAALHDAGLVHGDIKPSNLLVDPEQMLLKIADFGSATFAGASPAQQAHDRQFSGTPQFTSPEQADGNNPSAQSDIYSLGLTLLAMVEGKSRFEGFSTSEVLEQQKARQAIALDDVPEPLKGIIGRCLQPEPQDRYQGAHDLAREMRRIAAQQNVAKPAESPDMTVTLAPLQAQPLSDKRKAMAENGALAAAAEWIVAHPRQMTAPVQFLGNPEAAPPDETAATAFTVALRSDLANDPEIEVSVRVSPDGSAEAVSSRPVSVSGKTGLISSPQRVAGLAAFVVLIPVVIFIAAAMLSDGGTQSSRSVLDSVRVNRDFQVDFEELWQDTGIDISATETISIVAEGEAFFSGCCSVRPDGVSTEHGASYLARDWVEPDMWLHQDSPNLSLIGRIGDSPPFYIGHGVDFTSDREGRLFLAPNEQINALHDNEGSWSASIQVGMSAEGYSLRTTPDLFVYRDPDTGRYTGEVVNRDGLEQSYTVFRPNLAENNAAQVVGVDVTDLGLLEEGETACFFVRENLEAGFGLASRLACATNRVSDFLELDDIVRFSSSGATFAVAIDEAQGRVFTAVNDTLVAISLDSREIEREIKLDLPPRSRVFDMDIHPQTGQLIFTGGFPQNSFVGFLDTDLIVDRLIRESDIDLIEVSIPRDKPEEVFITGDRGWLVLNTEGDELRRVQTEEQVTAEGIVSFDGSFLFGQKGDSVGDDAVVAFDAVTGEELARFVYGDKGGSLHFYERDGIQRLLVFIGNGSITQNAFVLSVPDLEEVQDLNTEGLAWGAELADGSVVVGQNWSIAGSQHTSGISLVRLAPTGQGKWRVSREMELEAGIGSGPVHLTCSITLNLCATPSSRSGNLYLFSVK